MFELMLKLMTTKQFSFKDGELKLLGIRDCFTPLDTYISFQKELEKIGKEELIYSSAKKAGFEWFRSMSENFKDITKNKASQWGADLVSLSGWGKAEIEKVDFLNNYGIFLLKNSTVARCYGRSNFPVDHLFRGLLAGGMSFGTKKDLDSIEIECVAKGDKICKFVVGDDKYLRQFK